MVASVALLHNNLQSVDQENLLKEFNSLVTDINNFCFLCSELLSMEFAGSVVLDRCETIVSMIMKHRVVSLCTLRWLAHTISDSTFVSSHSYAALCPVLLQFVVTSTYLYPEHHPECFTVLRLMYENKAKLEDANTGRSIEIVSIKRDILDSVIYLIGSGYASGPMHFLMDKISVSDAAIARHIVLTALESFSPPFEASFANDLLDIVLFASDQKALSSRNFEQKHGPQLLRKFYAILSEMSNIDTSKIARLGGTF